MMNMWGHEGWNKAVVGIDLVASSAEQTINCSFDFSVFLFSVSRLRELRHLVHTLSRLHLVFLHLVSTHLVCKRLAVSD